MDNTLAQEIGNRVVTTLENNFRKETGNNYTLSDYIEDFEGDQKELNITLIKLAAKIL